MWHVFGATHIPRPEDFPVMPVETVGEAPAPLFTKVWQTTGKLQQAREPYCERRYSCSVKVKLV